MDVMYKKFHFQYEKLEGMKPLTRLPSEIIREHFRLSSQPMEEPEDPKQFLPLLEMLGSDDMLLFATDYPHWDFDAPDQAFPVRLPAALERKIMSENARAVYRLPHSSARVSPEPAVASPGALRLREDVPQKAGRCWPVCPPVPGL